MCVVWTCSGYQHHRKCYESNSSAETKEGNGGAAKNEGRRIWKLQAVDNVVVLIHLVSWRIVVTVSGCAEFCL
jgi:hypothetical protein